MSRYSVIAVHRISMIMGDVPLFLNNFRSAVIYLTFHLILGGALQVKRCDLVSAFPHKQQASDG